jgi:hypothetical protein
MASGRNKVAPETGSTFSRAHQFRTRNDLIKTQRARSNSNEDAAKSTKLISIPPLITLWLQVRALSEPTTKSIAQNPVYGRDGLSPQVSGSPFIVRAGWVHRS